MGMYYNVTLNMLEAIGLSILTEYDILFDCVTPIPSILVVQKVKLVFIIMCEMVIFLEFLDIPSDSVPVDTYVKWIPRLYILKGVDKVTCFFLLALIDTFVLTILQFHVIRRFMIDTWSCAITSSNIPKFGILQKT